ncbi:MAG: ABC transporter permease [Ancalomicrobiaceae bacterium]|nr:ABC transporter permease [Ancalomicrobiaceae bacterium]
MENQSETLSGAPSRRASAASPQFKLSRLAAALVARREASVVAVLVVVFVGLSIASPYFLTVRNLANVAQQISVVGIVALGQALVIISGGLDLSVGSVIGLASVSAALATAATGSPFVGIVAAIGVGLVMGVANGLLVTRLRINPFIATLGTMSVARGSAMLLTNARPQAFDNWASFIGGGRIFGVPAQFIWLVLLTGAVWVFATRTRWGRNIYAMGDNAKAAIFAGIDTKRLTVFVFALCGTLAGFGGLLIAGLLNNANPNLGLGYELDVIAAVILGGVALTGGRGGIPGVVAGAALMGLLRNGFVLLSVSAYWQTIVIGLVVLVAVGVDGARRTER